LEFKIEDINKSELKLQEEEEKNHKEEVEFLKKTNERYKTELEKLLSGPKKWAINLFVSLWGWILLYGNSLIITHQYNELSITFCIMD